MLHRLNKPIQRVAFLVFLAGTSVTGVSFIEYFFWGEGSYGHQVLEINQEYAWVFAERRTSSSTETAWTLDSSCRDAFMTKLAGQLKRDLQVHLSAEPHPPQISKDLRAQQVFYQDRQKWLEDRYALETALRDIVLRPTVSWAREGAVYRVAIDRKRWRDNQGKCPNNNILECRLSNIPRRSDFSVMCEDPRPAGLVYDEEFMNALYSELHIDIVSASYRYELFTDCKVERLVECNKVGIDIDSDILNWLEYNTPIVGLVLVFLGVAFSFFYRTSISLIHLTLGNVFTWIRAGNMGGERVQEVHVATDNEEKRGGSGSPDHPT